MDKATLVSLDIETGSLVVSALETAKIPVNVALWMITPEYEDGRLVIASSALDQNQPLRAYQAVAHILGGQFAYSLPPLLILRMRDPFIKQLRDLFSKTSSVRGMRIGGQTIGNRYISEGYVYQIK